MGSSETVENCALRSGRLAIFFSISSSQVSTLSLKFSGTAHLQESCGVIRASIVTGIDRTRTRKAEKRWTTASQLRAGSGIELTCTRSDI